MKRTSARSTRAKKDTKKGIGKEDRTITRTVHYQTHDTKERTEENGNTWKWTGRIENETNTA